ncbi:cell division protein FtsA, partial [Dethiobacter alkaliphilus AHT 1]
INFETNPPAGRNTLMLRVNGREAEFTTQLKHGDRLEVGWSA